MQARATLLRGVRLDALRTLLGGQTEDFPDRNGRDIGHREPASRYRRERLGDEMNDVDPRCRTWGVFLLSGRYGAHLLDNDTQRRKVRERRLDAPPQALGPNARASELGRVAALLTVDHPRRLDSPSASHVRIVPSRLLF
jgi:hypothetical protein